MTGIDARGRKQYLYHTGFREKQEKNKYFRIIKFAKALPKIRKVVRKDLKRKNLDKQKVLAAIVRLMEVTLIRIGNEEYAKSNKSYGLTTMKDKHVKISGNKIEFSFLGKSKKEHDIGIKDAKLALKVFQLKISGLGLALYLLLLRSANTKKSTLRRLAKNILERR